MSWVNAIFAAGAALAVLIAAATGTRAVVVARDRRKRAKPTSTWRHPKSSQSHVSDDVGSFRRGFRDMEKWVVSDDVHVTSAYFVGPGAEAAARARAEETGGIVWYIHESWTRT